MKGNGTREKGLKNLFYGIIGQIVILALGLLLPRLYMVSYGSEVNGLLTSVKQIFAYMTLLEAGVGATTLQALYAPMANKKYNEVSKILVATDLYYKKTGAAYASLVLVIALLYSIIIKTDISFFTVFFVIVFQGAAGVIKYLFQGKYTLLMQVDGKNYVLSNLTLFVTVVSDIAQVILIFMGFNIVAVKFSYFVLNLIQMAYIMFYVKKHYEWIDLKQTANLSALSQKSSALIHSISGLVFNNTDTIILSVFCGLKTVSVYSVYALVFNVMANLIDVVSNSFNFAMGQVFYSDFEKYKKVQDCYEAMYLAATFSLLTITYIFITPFISLYTKSIDDIAYVDKWLPVLFTACNALNYGRKTSNQIINFAGHFKETRSRAMAEMGINLVVSVISVNFWGIYGVLLGTFAALLYRANDVILYANRIIMKRSPWLTYKRWGINIGLFFASIYLASKLRMNITSYTSLFAYAMPISFCIILLFFLTPLVYEKELGKFLKSFFVERKTRGRIQ